MMGPENEKNIYRFPEIQTPESEHARKNKDEALLKDETIKQAQQEGYDNGYAQGLEQITLAEQAKLRPLRELLDSGKEALRRHQSLLRAAAPRDAADLAMDLARDLVAYEARRRPDLVVHVLRKTLLKVKGRDQLKVKTHPEDCEQVKEMLRREIIEVDPSAKVDVFPDPAVQKGSCLVETEFGVVDARFEKQFDTLAQSLSYLSDVKRRTRVEQDQGPPDLDQLFDKVKTMDTINTYGYVSLVAPRVRWPRPPGRRLC